jgi:hypothetical protein
VAVSFFGGVKPEYMEKTTDLTQGNDKIYFIMRDETTGVELKVNESILDSCTSLMHVSLLLNLAI